MLSTFTFCINTLLDNIAKFSLCVTFDPVTFDLCTLRSGGSVGAVLPRSAERAEGP